MFTQVSEARRGERTARLVSTLRFCAVFLGATAGVLLRDAVVASRSHGTGWACLAAAAALAIAAKILAQGSATER